VTGPRWLLWRAALLTDDPVAAYPHIRRLSIDEVVQCCIIGQVRRGSA